MKNIYLILFVLFLSLAFSQEQVAEVKSYPALRVNPHAPAIDGIPDDIIWKKAVSGDGFIQHDPVEGDSATEKTYFKICYDQENLYVLIAAYDSEPEKIAARLSRRDDVDDSDMVGILLDSYYDRRTAFEFTLNAAGVKYDAVYSDDNFNPDENWDPVWDGEVAINDSGWVAEMRIPFSQLRFASNNTDTWGLEVYRYIHRKKENDQWRLIPKDSPGFVSQFGKLTGIANIKVPKKIELLPYTVSKFHSYDSETGNPFANGRDFSVTGGLDGKIGITGNLTVDFTINPDFGQVEADPSEVNLSAFESFFEEKRPFFIEGKNIFQFTLGFGDGGFSRETLFYSRRIGRSPHHYPDVGDDEYVESPERTSILGAAKLSGKTSSGWSIGILDAMTAREEAKIQTAGNRTTETVEPFTNYFVGRLQKDFHEGNTSFGGMFTSTNRNIEESHLDFINRSAYTGGMDFKHQWDDKTYFVDAKLAYSHVRGHKDAMLEVQTSSARYFQRPDADHVTLDSSRTHLSGHGGSLVFGKQGNGRLRFAIGTLWRSPGFEINDIGYLREADNSMAFGWLGYRIYNPVGIFRTISVNLNHWRGWNFDGEKLFTGGNINGGAQFTNYWRFWMGVNRQERGLNPAALRGGPAVLYEGSWNNWFSLYSDSRKSWQVSFNTFNNWDDDGISGRNNYQFDLTLKPSHRLNLSVRPFYNLNKENLQYVSTIELENSDRYIMARLDQKTLGIVFRFNLSITPELTIQYYGQPFISAGSYSHFKRITAPRAHRYENRFHTFSDQEIKYVSENEEYQIDENRDGTLDYSIGSPDFNFKQFRSNLVIRWEYLPGSQLYLVWSQGRTGYEEFGDFSFNRDFRDLFSITPDNIFLIKFNHWFSI